MGEILVSSHPSFMLGRLNDLLGEGKQCDVTLHSQTGSIKAHRLVLYCASPFFANILQEPVAELYNLNYISEDVLQTIINFIYTSVLEVTIDNVDDVLKVLEVLEMQTALSICREHIENTTINNSREELPASIELVTDSDYCSTAADLSFKDENEEPSKKKPKRSLSNCRKNDKPRKVVSKRKKTIPRKNVRVKRSKILENNPLKLSFEIKKEVFDDNQVNDLNNYENQVSYEDNSGAKATQSGFQPEQIHKVEDNGSSDTDDFDMDDFENEIQKTKAKKKLKSKSSSEVPPPKKKRGRAPRVGEKPKRIYKKRVRKNYPCSQCSRMLSSFKRKVFHEFSKHGTPYDDTHYTMTPCTEEGCSYVAADKRSLQTHMKSRHGVARPHVCEFCGKSFKLATILATHLNIHTGAKLWKCEYCGDVFNQQSGLDIHIKRHHMGEASWAELCHLCSEKFMLKSELTWHLFKVHNQPLPDKFKVFECPLCSFATKNSKDFERHSNIHKGVNVYKRTCQELGPSKSGGEWRHICDICGFTTMKKAGLISHRERHDGIKNHVCPICQKGCSTKSELRRHVSFHGEKKFKCHFEGCSFACTDQIGLDKHIWLMHTHKNYKPYACPVCPYRTGVRGNVDKHIRTVHDLVVVTKHTVSLKMKYPDFSSGDVITKDGRLVATAQERKALQEGPPMDKQGNVIQELGTDCPLPSTAGAENKKYKRTRKSSSNTALPAKMEHLEGSMGASEQQTEVSAAVSNLPSIPGVQPPASSHTKDLTALTNFVYVHGDLVIGSSIPNTAATRPDTVQSPHSADQPSLFHNVPNTDIFLPSKFEYGD